MKLVIWPSLPGEWVKAIQNVAGNAIIVTPETEAEALDAAGDAEGWIGRITPEILAKASQLRWLQAPSISLENFVFPELEASEVVLTHYRHIFDDHIANHVLALFLAHCRGLHPLFHRQREGRWEPKAATVSDPAAMNVLILGLGGIGCEVARRLSVFGPKVRGIDPRLESFPTGVDEMGSPDRIREWLPDADVVAVCAPLTPQTQGLFDEGMFRLMKPEAFLINIGRGKIVRQHALEKALTEGWIAGAGLDVFETEPLAEESPLWKMENVILTPHTAWKGPHVEERQLDAILKNVERFVLGETLLHMADKALWY